MAGDRRLASVAATGDVWILYPTSPSPEHPWVPMGWFILAIVGTIVQLGVGRTQLSGRGELRDGFVTAAEALQHGRVIGMRIGLRGILSDEVGETLCGFSDAVLVLFEPVRSAEPPIVSGNAGLMTSSTS